VPEGSLRRDAAGEQGGRAEGPRRPGFSLCFTAGDTFANW